MSEYNFEGGSWWQENFRMIISVAIVGAIALGIYSYSQRTPDPADVNKPATVNNVCDKYGDFTDTSIVPIRCKSYWNITH